MKKLPFILVILLIAISCRPRYQSAVEYIYTADYNKQDVMAGDAIEDADFAIRIGVEYFWKHYDDYIKNDFIVSRPCDMNLSSVDIKATLVAENSIWKVKLCRHGERLSVENPMVNYLVYLRKKDGAMLYIRMERGEWIGDTDVEERRNRPHE